MGAPNWPKIAPSDRSRSAEEPVLKEPIKTFVGIIGVYVPMSVADANMFMRFTSDSGIGQQYRRAT